MRTKNIKSIRKAQKINMGGIFLDQALPLQGVDMVDPFLLVHHLDDKFDPDTDYKSAGVGPHPHRGFTPVSFVFKGGVHHRDSMNNSSIIYSGGTQWMHSGKGVVHSERPAKEIAEKGEQWELIQFWVNVPKAKKMIFPYYVPLTEEETPAISGKNFKIGIVSGSLNGKKGPIQSETEVLALRMEFKTGAEEDVNYPENYNGFMYLLDGKAVVNGKEVSDKNIVFFGNEGENISIKATENFRAILLAGLPINEPVTSYGPFVMNSETEIMQAIRDYQSGKMGFLVEDFDN